jgi:hypothetical protein
MRLTTERLKASCAASPKNPRRQGLSIDSSQNGSAAGATAVSSQPLSTTSPGDIVVACFEAEWPNAVGTLSTVKDNAGLTWAKRAGTTMHGGRANAYNDLECWWAFAPSTLASDVVTGTYGSAFDGATMAVVAVTGFTGTTCQTAPWDPNLMVPATTSSPSSGIPSASNVATTNAADMLIGVAGGGDYVGYSSGYVGTGFTFANGTPASGTANYSSIGFETMTVSATLR